jgi:hypothetical protein
MLSIKLYLLIKKNLIGLLPKLVMFDWSEFFLLVDISVLAYC